MIMLKMDKGLRVSLCFALIFFKKGTPNEMNRIKSWLQIARLTSHIALSV